MLEVFEGIFDGDIEHSEPFHVAMIDNPGWHLSFGRGWMPGLEGQLKLGQHHDGERWWWVQVKGGLIHGYCGAGDLPLLCGHFLEAFLRCRHDPATGMATTRAASRFAPSRLAVPVRIRRPAAGISPLLDGGAFQFVLLVHEDSIRDRGELARSFRANRRMRRQGRPRKEATVSRSGSRRGRARTPPRD
ncbi:MAG: hypothetical protein H6721_22235 [Sandaracinus sp.]|nr:hypothetical protein [Sandaracinus sp.]MCB9623044.1 hypothetical protein [Sandaracinus sp.]MCB9634854.1 hypothetical protein [Sandaracinus sp.]